LPNEQRVHVHLLQDGDVVSLGIHELIYSDLRSAAMKKKATIKLADTGVNKKQA